jgi:hypothetical protein
LVDRWNLPARHPGFDLPADLGGNSGYGVEPGEEALHQIIDLGFVTLDHAHANAAWWDVAQELEGARTQRGYHRVGGITRAFPVKVFDPLLVQDRIFGWADERKLA